MTGRHRSPTPEAHRPDGPAAAADPDVLVVGAGPAGSTVAGLLARSGVDVLLVDRATFPRPKACGECVNPGAVAALERLGLLDAVRALDPAPLAGWRIRGDRARAEGRFAPGRGGLGVARADLDAALVEEAVARGARLREGVRVEEVDVAPDVGGRPSVRLRTPAGLAEVRPRLVVGADGLRSRVARAVGRTAPPGPLRKVSVTARLDWPGGPAGSGFLSVRDGVTLGLAPVRADGRRWNATVVGDARATAAALAGDPLAFLLETLEARLGADPARHVVDGPWTSGPFDLAVARAWAPGVVLVGDAAGYYDPFTGQGIYRALRSAELAAPAVAAALGAPDAPWTPLARYADAWRRETRGPRALQRVIEAVMSRPSLRERVLPFLGTRRLLDRLVRVTGDAAPLSCLVHLDGWLPGRRPGLDAAL